VGSLSCIVHCVWCMGVKIPSSVIILIVVPLVTSLFAPDNTSTSFHLQALSTIDTPTLVGKCRCSQSLLIVQSCEMEVGNSIVLKSVLINTTNYSI
jgi:hypothetical protein